MPSILIIGCGYLGRIVADNQIANGNTVYALTRNRSAELQALGIKPITGDVTGSLQLPQVDNVLFAVGMDRSAGKTMRDVYLHGLENVLQDLQTPERFIYISSSSVYGQTDGEWVDETSDTTPLEENGRIILECEQLLLSKLALANILRFSGIYGPNRILRRLPLVKGEPLVGNAEKWLNLIHVHDGATAVDAVFTHGTPGRLFNVADDRPATRREFYTMAGELLKAPEARFEPGPETARHGGHRRISNRRLKIETGWQPQFTDFTTGLQHAVAHTIPPG